MVHALLFNLDLEGVSNNNEITIIAITGLDYARYCFVNFIESESDGYGESNDGSNDDIYTHRSDG